MKRYDMDIIGIGDLDIQRSENGDWVKFEDVEYLLQEAKNAGYNICKHPLLARERIDKHTLVCNKCGDKL